MVKCKALMGLVVKGLIWIIVTGKADQSVVCICISQHSATIDVSLLLGIICKL